ncbi:dihydrolipoyllysine-residue acetyltransferase [Ignatzschineria cameli]|uniref:Acetyltransferase component of pyruvate dehydrogenase complex n=1 Tax=Ignatzschineria cameli TaxID=2182793 RepID=A0A2U2ARS4_9GAMM|nr:dihydrolipoyllysine-residue acetyltransferase [Ignatzschineria cameli]PWD86703.1 dihydrolipoyllysine-residue acetyltransferase [Ignatzschineria cameli]PWD86944.1 dihydrolipoyllysine-residue acetyltransferase [Ignatzschineria cameli]PWD91916.1 dihydrolipoyllysine-residue acetyltransferase [Ignatzschineria cameli]PWD93497.1 dihydrolipoyllysine-residue acetyltransferase [Ignatzschineria cameli]PWD94239.1 dihydrolipoyllysine-residue acetyltransferase [Ignatzschineria cameli]
MANIDLRVPDIGNSDAVDVIEINVKVGDIVAVDDTLVTLESDKASMDVPAEAAGKITEILVTVGDQVQTGDVIARVEAVSEADATVNNDAAEMKSEVVTAPSPKAPAVAEASTVKSSSTTGGEIAEITIPAVGNSDELDVIDIAVKVGDHVKLDDTLVTLESDKASMDVPADKEGVITEIALSVGDKVKEGDLVVKIQTGGETQSAQPASQLVQGAKEERENIVKSSPDSLKAPHKGDQLPVAPAQNAAELDFSGAHATPSVRAFARELGADLNQVQGSGRNNRILREDVLQYVKGVLSGTVATAAGAKTTVVNGGGLDLLPWPKVDFSKFGEVEERELSRIQKISGANLARNWAMIPHVAQFDEADITELEALRKQLNKEYEREGVRVTILAFLFKAVVKALQKFPEFNSSLEGDKLILKKYYHIGFAADTPNGLVVPVIRDCDKKGVLEIATEMRELAGLAREGKLRGDQMTGGCFTISSLGGIGGTNFIPIINAPEVAILGVAKNQIKPVWNGKEFEPRLMIPLSLSYDHRVIDGALGARFIVYLNELLTDMRRMVI